MMIQVKTIPISNKHENTVNSRFKKDLKLQIHVHTAFFLDDRYLDSLHKSFLNPTTLDLRKEKWTFLNREFTVLEIIHNKFIIHLLENYMTSHASHLLVDFSF